MQVPENKYDSLIQQIGLLLKEGRQKAAQSINTILVQTYWEIGKHIVEFEQGGKQKAEYGAQLLDKLSKDLSLMYGKGFGRSNLIYIRRFYISFQISGTVSHLFMWSH
ncbi:DUF1016 N-terminal domain-containing protein [Parasediminibacterium sp. JCM 36343]|uniref:DUF1016 N-terminal domain-containing protein n=1 Tax=Parasediminibacterium sp. JCM 36343 TaxID=3374279 RepID=UPI00397DF2A1